jgi:hypothetical protein
MMSLKTSIAFRSPETRKVKKAQMGERDPGKDESDHQYIDLNDGELSQLTTIYQDFASRFCP